MIKSCTRLSIILPYMEAITKGCTLSDKFLILVNLLLLFTYPINYVFYRLFHKIVLEPSIIGSFKCKNSVGIFRIPAGTAVMQMDDAYEPSVHEVLESVKDGVFVDVGASIGIYTVKISKQIGNRGQVVSAEPDSKRFRFLNENILINKCSNVTTLNLACWSKEGTMPLYEHIFGVSWIDNSLVVEQGHSSYRINVDTLDSILAKLNIKSVRAIKIDVEGAELEVLKGMEKTLGNSNPMIIFEALTDINREQCKAYLESKGYTVRKLRDGNFYAEKEPLPKGSQTKFSFTDFSICSTITNV